MKKGFTLIELLGVIILLAIIALIAYPIIDKAIKNSRESAYQQQINSIITSAKTYVEQENIKENEIVQTLTLNLLKDKGYISSKDIINPIDHTIMNGCVLYLWNKNANQFSFEYSEDCERSSLASCFTFDSNTQTITGYNRECGDVVTIPSKIDGVEVKHIGDYAFSYVYDITNIKGDTYVNYIIVDDNKCAGGCEYITPYDTFINSNMKDKAVEYMTVNLYTRKDTKYYCYISEEEKIEKDSTKAYSIEDGYISCMPDFEYIYEEIYGYCREYENRNDIVCNYYGQDKMSAFGSNSNYIKPMIAINQIDNSIMKFQREPYEKYYQQGNIIRVNFTNAKYLETIGNNAFAYNQIRVIEFGELPNLKEIKSLAFAGNNISTIDMDNLSGLKRIETMAFLENRLVSIDISQSLDLKYIGESAFCSYYNDCGREDIDVRFPNNDIWKDHYYRGSNYLFNIGCNCIDDD